MGLEDLTEQQQLFLDAMADEINNPTSDVEVAKEFAGYPPTYSSVKLIRELSKALEEDIRFYLLGRSLFAAKKMFELASDPNPLPGSEKILNASKEILDRAGITKKDKIELETTGPIHVIELPSLVYNKDTIPNKNKDGGDDK